MQTQKIPKEKKYLNEAYDTLPLDVILNKGLTGCGATNVALIEPRKTIIAVPFVSLIESKMNQVKGDLFPYPVMGVYGTWNDEQERNLKAHSTVENNKILCTYDALPKLMECIDPSYYHLAIDEYHILTKHYDFRHEAIQGVLKNFRKFKGFTFITATPVEDEFTLEELKGIDTITLEWESKTNITFKPTKCKDVNSTTATIITDYLDGKQKMEN